MILLVLWFTTECTYSFFQLVRPNQMFWRLWSSGAYVIVGGGVSDSSFHLYFKFNDPNLGHVTVLRQVSPSAICRWGTPSKHHDWPHPLQLGKQQWSSVTRLNLMRRVEGTPVTVCGVLGNDNALSILAFSRNTLSPAFVPSLSHTTSQPVACWAPSLCCCGVKWWGTCDCWCSQQLAISK